MKKFGFFFLILLLVSCVHGDGRTYYTYSEIRDTLHPLSQHSQVAVINYQDGVEDLLISIRVNPEGEGLFWIFPVPYQSEKAEIDLMQEFPSFSGYDPKSRLGVEIKNSENLMYLSQVWVFPVLAFTYMGIFSMGGSSSQSSMRDYGISVHQVVEKQGIRSELLSAESVVGLQSYLDSKGVLMPDDLNQGVEEYIGEDYSFVVSWITNTEEYRKGLNSGDIALRVRFPTDRIYYPLKLTSLYGDKYIPIRLYVLGRVKPELYESIKESTVTKYFISEGLQVSSELSSFFGYDGEPAYISNVKYTKVSVDTLADNLNEDLWLDEHTPLDILFADFLAPIKPIVPVVLFALFSCLASLVAGMLNYKKIEPVKFIYLGLFNFFTLIGFSIAASKILKEKIRFRKKPTPEKKETSDSSILRWWYIIPILLILGFIAYPPLFIVSIFLLIILVVPLLILLYISNIGFSNSKFKGYMMTTPEFRRYIISFSLLFLFFSFIGIHILIGIFTPKVIAFGFGGGTGMSGFGPIKPLDHASTGEGLSIALTNGAGARVDDVGVSIEGETEYIKSMPAGGKGEVTFSPMLGLCTGGAESYDVEVFIFYTNSVTRLNHTGSGRIWGAC